MKEMSVKLQRLADQVRDVIALSFSGGRINDPRLQNITITYVKLSSDLSIANVYYLANKDEVEKVQKGLWSVRKYLRHQISESVKIRQVPDLKFFYDDSVEEGSKIENLLNQIR